MAKVVQLRGQTPSGWKQERWRWIGAVLASVAVSDRAKLVAVSMAQGFANHETAECRPGVAALCRAVALDKRAVQRALADLREAGFVQPLGGEGPGKLAGYRFCWPGERVTPATPERVTPATPERVTDLTPTGDKSSAPPIPPYKDEPKLNHTGTPQKPASISAQIRGPQQPRVLTHIIAPGSTREALWDEWLARHGYAPLSEIGFKAQGGWRMPVSVAPRETDEIPFGIAVAWAEWLRSKA